MGHQGGCLCGDIRYEVEGAAVWKAGCCCRSCTLAAGAPLMSWAGFEPSAVRLLRGEPALYRSTPSVVRGFCARCGTTLTYRKEAAGDPALEEAASVIYLATTTLDDPDAYPPDEIVRAGERPRWLDLGPGVPVHEVLSPGNAHLMFGEAGPDET